MRGVRLRSTYPAQRDAPLRGHATHHPGYPRPRLQVRIRRSRASERPRRIRTRPSRAGAATPIVIDQAASPTTSTSAPATRPTRHIVVARCGSRQAREVAGAGSNRPSATGSSKVPRSTIRNSRASDGTRISEPTASPTSVATSVARGAAAWSIVRPGSSSGRWASAQPAIDRRHRRRPTRARRRLEAPRCDEGDRRDAGERRDDDRRHPGPARESMPEPARVLAAPRSARRRATPPATTAAHSARTRKRARRRSEPPDPGRVGRESHTAAMYAALATATHTDGDRGGVEPAREQIAAGVPGGAHGPTRSRRRRARARTA